MKYSIIIPAYNEEKILGKVLDDVKKMIASNGHDAEIIVVDDASRDGTAEVARSMGVMLLRHERNRGYGASLKTGIRASGGEVIVILDGDGSYPVEEIPVLLEDIDKYDMVVGARIKKGAKMPFLRKIPKFFLTKLAEFFVEKKIPDVNSGLRVFRKKIYDKYSRILPAGFSFTMTLTLSVISAGEKITFVPVGYNKRKGRSKIRPVHDTINFFILIIRTILYFKPLRVFLPMGMLFMFAAAGLAVYSISVGRLMDVTITLLFVTGVQLAILGLIADLIDRKIKYYDKSTSS